MKKVRCKKKTQQRNTHLRSCSITDEAVQNTSEGAPSEKVDKEKGVVETVSQMARPTIINKKSFLII